MAKADPDAPKTAHTLRSSNFPFYAAVWDAAKQCEGVIALEKRFHWAAGQSRKRIPGSGSGSPSGTSSPAPGSQDGKTQKQHKGRTSVLVDIVAKDGLEWVKVSTLTEKRMLFDIAKAGWVGSDSEFSSDDGNDSDDEPEGLLRQAEGLVRASKASRIRYQYPEIRIVLPKIGKGCVKEVESVLSQIENLGIKIVRKEEIKASSEVEEVMSRMMVDEFAHFTDTINVDCTILLALVSDLSHMPVEAEDWHHKAVKQQIVRERGDQLLPKGLWPACGNRKLVCTKEAKQRMMEIVQLIGTDAEKQRTELIIGGGRSYSTEERIRGLQDLSSHRTPIELKLPIETVEVDILEMEKEIGHLATAVKEELTTINQSVFFYGWAKGLTTVSSNRTVAKEVENCVEANRKSDDERGPDIWLCATARSLVGKEKTRRDGKGLRVV
mgnify:CR=1 FL=1